MQPTVLQTSFVYAIQVIQNRVWFMQQLYLVLKNHACKFSAYPFWRGSLRISLTS